MSSSTNNDDRRIDLANTKTLPKPTPDVGHVYKAEPSGDIDDACVGTLARFPGGTVVVRSFDDVRHDSPGAGNVETYDGAENALDAFDETFQSADVWFDWDTE